MIDRSAALQSAEKFLRQGKLEPAIAEYLRIATDQPGDWNTANIVGDLYVRAGKIDQAIGQFIAIGDRLMGERSLPKASAFFKKVLKLEPEHEYALLQCATAAAEQGVLVDARTFLRAVLEQRRGRGDVRGAAEIVIRLGALDPKDHAARLSAARARLDLDDDVGSALDDLEGIATELVEENRLDEAAVVAREALTLAPADGEISGRLAAILAKTGAAANPQPTDVAAAAPSADHLAGVEPPTADEHATWRRAEELCREGTFEEGWRLLHELFQQDPARKPDVVLLGLRLAPSAPDQALRLVDLATEAARATGDWAAAAADFQELVARAPAHIPTLLRLVEIAVDGQLTTTMQAAQVQLVDAYLGAGIGHEARFVAEDLIAQEPGERAHVERLRRALVILGETDPDSSISSRLSDEHPFVSTDNAVSALSRHLPDDEKPALDAEARPSRAQPLESPSHVGLTAGSAP